jgi:diguanylate cyclase (GGDEF)-like protein
VIPRSWAIWRVSADLLALILATEFLALVFILYGTVVRSPNHTDVIRFAAFCVLSSVFQAASSKVVRMRLRLANGAQVDMTLVWTFAGGIALPGQLAVALIGFVSLITLRSRYKVGLHPYREVFGAASVVLACLSAAKLFSISRSHLVQLPAPTANLIALALAILCYATVNGALTAGAIYLADRPVPFGRLLGTWESRILELAALCLGGLAAMNDSALIVLVVVPMLMLQRGALAKEVESAAVSDATAGLFNAVTWRQLAQRDLSRALRENQSAAVFVVNIDNIEFVNDTYGEIVGDAVQKAVADCLIDLLRDYDRVGHLGTGEFVALLCDLNAATAVGIADRIRRRVSSLAVPSLYGSSVPLSGFSASIGVACYPQHGTEVDLLLQAAGSALAATGRHGNDRIEVVETLRPSRTARSRFDMDPGL